jgi:hypothetical protein
MGHEVPGIKDSLGNDALAAGAGIRSLLADHIDSSKPVEVLFGPNNTT